MVLDTGCRSNNPENDNDERQNPEQPQMPLPQIEVDRAHADLISQYARSGFGGYLMCTHSSNRPSGRLETPIIGLPESSGRGLSNVSVAAAPWP